MTRRARISAWVLGAALLVGAVIVLKVDTDGPSSGQQEPFPRFAADSIVLPQARSSVPEPGPVTIFPGPGRLRLAWADGMPGGVAPEGVSGYEVRWLDHVRFIAQPAVQLDGLEQRDYQVEVRSVDPLGQRSKPVRVGGSPAASPPIPGVVDHFDSTASVHSEVLGSRWHVSGYRGCVDLASELGTLAIQLSCGDDDAVLRARAALKLGSGPGELGRVTAVTDAAGPYGEFMLDLVPGPADWVGSRNSDVPALPDGAIRVSISDSGVRITTGRDVAQSPVTGIAPAARRGSGVLHRFDVALTSSRLEVLQDGLVIGATDVRPPWNTATVLLGVRGPRGRQTVVHIDTVALSAVVPPQDEVVEFSATLGTQRVLKPEDTAPGIGVAHEPLLGATSARLRATLWSIDRASDLGALTLQIGDRTVPLRLATPGPPPQASTFVTVVADLPPDLLADAESTQLSPLVFRGQAAANLVESYLEITPGPTTRRATPKPDARLKPRVPALPAARVELPDTTSVAAPFKMQVILDGGLVQRDADELVAIRGFEVFLEDRMIASVPTDLSGPAVGGSYELTVALQDQLPGEQTLDIRVHPADPKRRPQSTLLDVSLVR